MPQTQQSARYFAPIDFRTRFPALDGLRALAICGVFAAHYGGGSHGGKILNLINLLRGYGSLGVDLFFVLSGFLITGILYDTLGDSRYFLRFFARRSLRIFPIYYLVFAVLLLLTPIALYQWHWGHALFLIYMGNFLGNYDFSYYSVESQRSHMLLANIGHFWSLCVEEQFYMLWPIAVFLLRKRRNIFIAGVTISLLAIALRAAEFAWQGPVVAERWIVRTLPFRMDALLIGGMLALLLRGPHADRIQRSCKWVFLAGTAASIAIFVLSPEYDSAWGMIVGLTVYALAFAGLIGMTLRTGGPAYRLFNLKPLRVLGKYSYGFYIYHLLFRWVWIEFLVWCFGKFHSMAVGGVVALTTNFVVTFLVSKVSYDYFESRFLRYKIHFEYDRELTSHRHAFTTES
ncbi:acyltransferase [Terriglobus sp. TAA 43]|uniref:acyltransferase family protein n=1 Tax=Terriglobus sp. TAA 43 TaxID=278961 RepID=UPI000645F9A9|nr:acyltransferase [Terriglobus sp. TAA 43]